MAKPRFKAGDVLRWDNTELGHEHRARFGEPLIVSEVLGARYYRLKDLDGKSKSTDPNGTFCCDRCVKDEFLTAVKKAHVKSRP